MTLDCLREFYFISSYSPVSHIIIFISSYTAKNNYFSLYKLIQDLPYVHRLLVNRLFKPAQEKVWLGELSVPL